MRKRVASRHTKRLELTFAAGDSKFTGISSDLSGGGLFIRTQHGLTPGTQIDIEIYLPDGKRSRLRGVVRRTIKTPLSIVKNGMGIELIEKDQSYLDFLRQFDADAAQEKAAPSHDADGKGPPGTDRTHGETSPESIIIACHSCKAKNRVPRVKLPFGPKCGKCGEALDTRIVL